MTYSQNIRQEDTYEGLRIITTNAAMRELMKYGDTILDVKQVLETGYDAPRKRKQGTIEKWLQRKNKIYNAVIVKDYNLYHKEECWVLTHYGRFTK